MSKPLTHTFLIVFFVVLIFAFFSLLRTILQTVEDGEEAKAQRVELSGEVSI